MGLYNSDGSISVTKVSGTQLVGAQAPNGSINVVVDDAGGYGVRHSSGATRVNSSTAGTSVLDPSGAYYINKLFGVKGAQSVLFSPSSLTPTVWLEPAKGGLFQSNAGTTAALANNDVVGYLPDFSGNAKHYLSEANNTTRPTLQGVGGRPCLRFDGVNDFLMRTESLGLLAGGQYTLAFAFKSNSPAVDARFFAEGNTATNNTLFISLQASNPTSTTSSTLYRNDAGTQLVSPSTMTNTNVFNNTNKVFVLTDDGTSLRSYVNGATGATTNWTPSGVFTLNRSSIGCLLRAAAGNWWAGDFYGMVAIPRVLTSLEREYLTKYMGTLAGLSL